MKKLISDLMRRSFVRNVATVATGMAASQAITMAFSPLVTRLYGPEAYGLQGIFMSVVGLLGVLAALSYPIAIILPSQDGDAVKIARFSVYIGVATTLITTAILCFFGGDMLRLLNAEAISAFVYLMPLAMFASMLREVLRQWLIRKRAYSLIARNDALTSLLVQSAKTSLGLLHPTAMMLVLSNTVGGLLGTGLALLGWRRLAEQETNSRQGIQPSATTVELARRYKDFALLRTPQNFLNTLSQGFPVLLLGGYFGAGAAGHYSIAIAVLGMPTSLIGGAVMSVAYPRINDAIRNGEDVRLLLIKATVGMAAVGAAPFLIVGLFGPFLFATVYGDEWRLAGVYAQWLALWLFAGFINRPAVSAIPALELQGAQLVLEIVSITLRLGVLYIGFYLLNDAVSAIALFSAAGMFINVFLILFVIQSSTKQEQHR